MYENLNFHGLVYGVPDRAAAAADRGDARAGRAHRLARAPGADAVLGHEAAPRDRPRAGPRRRILFLDEPTVGLDAQSRDRLWGYIRRLRQERELTVVVTTHYIEEVEGCDRVCIIDRGRILALDTPAALKLAHGQELLRVVAGAKTQRRRRSCRAYADRAIRNDTEIVLKSSGDAFAESFLARYGSRIRDSSSRSRASKACSCRSPAASSATRPRARASGPMHSASAEASTRDDHDRDAPRPRAHAPSLPQLGGLYAIWLREVKRAVRDRGQLIGGVSRPLLWVLIMGIGLNPYFRGEIYGEVRFVVPFTYLQFIFPAVIVLNIMYTSVQSAVSVIWDREFGFLREILVSPLSRATILLGKVLGGATVALFHGCLVLVLARFADVSLNPVDILYGLAADVPARVRPDLARRGDRQPGPQLRGLRRLLQRRHPAALLHVELDLPARSVAHQRADARSSIRNGW